MRLRFEEAKMFDLDRFIESCRATLSEPTPLLAIRDLLTATLERPGDVEAALGTPTEGGIKPLHRSSDLTVLNIVWAPGMTLYPHNHHMWALIGLYGGREDNLFYRRVPERQGSGGVEQAGAKELRIKDVGVLGEEIIHSVRNPLLRQFTGAIHVYGGDFFSMSRSEWDPETLTERPYDTQRVIEVFAEANERFAAEQRDG